jgi:methionyl-tRNA formyltransferase
LSEHPCFAAAALARRAPIHRAIEAGDAETGVTIMQMDGLDTVPCCWSRSYHCARGQHRQPDDKLAVLGGRMIVEVLELVACGGLQPLPQPAEGVTYAHKIEKHEAAIDWSLPAEVIARRIRAFNPFPGAATVCQGETIKLWRCEIDSASRISDKSPGTILSENEAGVVVQCGPVLRLTELQRGRQALGGHRLPAWF